MPDDVKNYFAKLLEMSNLMMIQMLNVFGFSKKKKDVECLQEEYSQNIDAMMVIIKLVVYVPSL